MNKKAKYRYRVLLISIVVSLCLALVGLLSPDPTQCPDSYTQAQIDKAGCTVGAYIGPTPKLDYTVAALILAIGAGYTLIMLRKK